MMKATLTVCALILCVISMTGCIGTAPYGGCKTPITSHFKVPVPEYYKPAPVGAVIKHGTSTHTAYMSLISDGGLSVDDAAKSAGIKNITSVEYEYRNSGLFMFQQITMHVYGY